MMAEIKRSITWLLLGLFSLALFACSEMEADCADAGGIDADNGPDIKDDDHNPGSEGFDPQPEPDPRFAIRHLLLIKVVYGPEIWGDAQFRLRNGNDLEVALSPTLDGELTGSIPAHPGEILELVVGPPAVDQEDVYVVKADVSGEQPRASESFVPCQGGCQLDIQAPEMSSPATPTENIATPHLILYID